MIQVGQLFQRVPYFVRDINCEYKSVHTMEELVNEFLANYMLSVQDLVQMFVNNRDSLTDIHLTIKNGSMPNENLCTDFSHPVYSVTFEEQKDVKIKPSKVDSLILIEEFNNRKEFELAKTFDEVMGCDGKKLFISIKDENFDMFNPSSDNFDYRMNLLNKKNVIEDICKTFEISCEDLYKKLNPNIVKGVCKDLKITYKALSEEIGYKPDTVNKAASSGKVSEQLSKAINMYLENLRLKEYLKDFDIMKATLKKILD